MNGVISVMFFVFVAGMLLRVSVVGRVTRHLADGRPADSRRNAGLRGPCAKYCLCDALSLHCRAVSSKVMPTVHPFQTDDARLRPIHEKVLARERLSEDDALALYRTGDILAVGWMANSVRERMHGDKTLLQRKPSSESDQRLRCRVPACVRLAERKTLRVPTPWPWRKHSRPRLPDIARRSRSFTSSADCIRIFRSSIFLILFPASSSAFRKSI